MSTSSSRPWKIFIGCIPGNSNSQEISTLLNQFAIVLNVSLGIGRNKFNEEYCLGYGFGVCPTKKDVDILVQKSNSLLYRGRSISIREYKYGDNLESEKNNFNRKRLFFGGVAPGIPLSRVQEFFSQFGELENVYFANKVDELSLRYGYLVFCRVEDATHLINNKEGLCLDGCSIRLEAFNGKGVKSQPKNTGGKKNGKKNAATKTTTTTTSKETKPSPKITIIEPQEVQEHALRTDGQKLVSATVHPDSASLKIRGRRHCGSTKIYGEAIESGDIRRDYKSKPIHLAAQVSSLTSSSDLIEQGHFPGTLQLSAAGSRRTTTLGSHSEISMNNSNTTKVGTLISQRPITQGPIIRGCLETAGVMDTPALEPRDYRTLKAITVHTSELTSTAIATHVLPKPRRHRVYLSKRILTEVKESHADESNLRINRSRCSCNTITKRLY